MKRQRGVHPDKPRAPWASAEYLCARFWDHFEVEETPRNHMDTPCWRWTECVNYQGYGYIAFSHATLPQRKVTAHRLVLMLKLGRWPTDDEHACHECDFRACVNPLHIYMGNDVTNSGDRARRGRVVTWRKPGVPPANQIYSDAQMQEALDLYFGPEGNGNARRLHSIQSLAKQFAVTEPVVRRALRPDSKLSFGLTQAQRAEIKELYFGKQGQGSVCPPNSSLARWTAASIARHLGIARHSINSALLGDTFPNVKRPEWAQQYKGGVVNKRLKEASNPDPKQ